MTDTNFRTGDVVAFGHYSPIGAAIKWATDSGVTHVGMVIDSEFWCRSASTMRVSLLAEATPRGAVLSFLDKALEAEDSDIWHLPLSEESLKRLDLSRMVEFLREVIGSRYDVRQAVRSAFDRFDARRGLTYNEEDFERLFCSELVAACFEVMQVVPRVNASEVTPIDLCRWKVYEDSYRILKGTKDISGYNTLDPSEWDV